MDDLVAIHLAGSSYRPSKVVKTLQFAASRWETSFVNVSLDRLDDVAPAAGAGSYIAPWPTQPDPREPGGRGQGVQELQPEVSANWPFDNPAITFPAGAAKAASTAREPNKKHVITRLGALPGVCNEPHHHLKTVTARLRRSGIPVELRTTRTKPFFKFTSSDPAFDVDGQS